MKKEISGLSLEQAALRLQQFGPNVIQGKKRPPLIFEFFAQFKDFMVLILIAASVLAYFAGEKIDAIIIISIVFVNAGIGFAQEFKAERAIEALHKLLAPKARVIRAGVEQQIDASAIVPGDIIVLNEGDKICADAELVEENEIRIDESILTGESIPVSKDTGKNKKICMGTQVAHGTGRAVVVATGMRTEFGKIALLTTETKKDKSPLQKELAAIGVFVGKVTLGMSCVLFLLGYFVQGRAFVETLLFAVSVAVAAVPEGLPATITVALAIGVQRLAKKNAIVKQLASVETLGCATVICSDKTGTLTKNEMTVQEVVLGNTEITVTGIGYAPDGALQLGGADWAPSPHAELLFQCSALCNNAKLTHTRKTWKILGDPTEGSLLTLAEKGGVKMKDLAQEFERIAEIPFDSVRKRMSVVAREKESGKVRAYVKGAPDMLLALCTKRMENGEIKPFEETERVVMFKKNEAMAARALRVIALAYREVTEPVPAHPESGAIEQNLVFLGLVGMIDPPREDVKEAVALAHKAGIRVFIITGDHGLTAHAVARKLGIAQSKDAIILTGTVLEKTTNEDLVKLLGRGKETIFARVSPEHKLRIVQALKKTGEIVAVTGDGVNDAPALKRADIGIAMGITGTDVSKEAANMVLADDRFGTIVTAVIEGRTIYANMKKFIYFIFSSNIGEVVAVFSTILIGLPAPLTAVFMLIINTLTDVFPSLALGMEPVERNVLNKPPRNPNSKIMERSFIQRYLISGLWIGLITMAVFLVNLWIRGYSWGSELSMESSWYQESSTMAFVVLSLMQMVHAVNSRSETESVFRMNFFENRYLLAAILFTVASTIAIVQIPFFHPYLKTMALTGQQWALLTLVAFSILPFEEILKFLGRRKLKKSDVAL